jgi:hypothetical protein
VNGDHALAENGTFVARASVMPGGGLRRHRVLARQAKPCLSTVNAELRGSQFNNFENRFDGERDLADRSRAAREVEPIKLNQRPAEANAAATCPANRARSSGSSKT